MRHQFGIRLIPNLQNHKYYSVLHSSDCSSNTRDVYAISSGVSELYLKIVLMYLVRRRDVTTISIRTRLLVCWSRSIDGLHRVFRLRRRPQCERTTAAFVAATASSDGTAANFACSTARRAAADDRASSKRRTTGSSGAASGNRRPHPQTKIETQAEAGRTTKHGPANRRANGRAGCVKRQDERV